MLSYNLFSSFKTVFMITRLSHRWKINQKDIEAFALVVGDANPVHRDP